MNSNQHDWREDSETETFFRNANRSLNFIADAFLVYLFGGMLLLGAIIGIGALIAPNGHVTGKSVAFVIVTVVDVLLGVLAYRRITRWQARRQHP